jgi:hypothetical protein
MLIRGPSLPNRHDATKTLRVTAVRQHQLPFVTTDNRDEASAVHRSIHSEGHARHDVMPGLGVPFRKQINGGPEPATEIAGPWPDEDELENR